MKLLIRSDRGATLVENRFIDEYLPTANGEYVKVYLYLLRCASSGRDLSVSSIADVFDHTENDVCRALRYWEKKGLIQLTLDEHQLPVSLTFLSAEDAGDATAPSAPAAPSAERVIPAAPSAAAAKPAVTADKVPEIPRSSPAAAVSAKEQQAELPPRLHPTAARKTALAEDTEFSQLIFAFQAYVSRPLTNQEINNLIYFYDDLHFSFDLIEYLVEYCVEKGNPGPKYMEKVAQEWFKAGYTTPTQAKKDAQSHRKEYYAIFKYLGITGRSPGEAEVAYMKKWLNQFQLPLEVIQEGCSRTLLGAGKPDLRYLDGILSKWHDANVREVKDIAALGEKKPAENKPAERTGAKALRSAHKTGPTNRFNDFEQQRDYDWDDLTTKLINS